VKVGILSQWYDPEPGPAALPAVYAREMVRQGHTVTALTGFPNYPDGVVHEGYAIRRHMVERRDGVDVHRVAMYPEHSRSAVGRVLNYASFAGSATISGRTALRGVDAIWVYNSPVTVTLPLMVHSRRGRVPYFLHVQDLWPDSLIASGMLRNGLAGDRVAAMIRRVVRVSEQKSTVIGVISPGVKDLILERHPDVNPAKVVYAPNPTNESLFRPVDEIRRSLAISAAQGLVEVMYAGAVGDVQGLDTLLDAAKRIKDYSHIKVSIYGDGISRARLEQRVAEEGISNVTFHGRVSQHEIPQLIARAQIQLVSLASAPFLEFTTPSKIPSLLASGVPIIGQLAGDGARMLNEAGAGVVVTPGNADELADAIIRMVAAGPDHWARLGGQARRYYETRLSAESTTKIILESLTESISAT